MTPTERFWTHVDKQGPDECWLWNSDAVNKGYPYFQVDKKRTYGHTFSYELHVGPIPEGLEIDHRCRVRRCVNPAHLRVATRQQNQANTPGWGRSRFKGVSWHSAGQRWQVHLKVGTRRLYLGLFTTELEAAQAYDTAALDAFGEFAFLNGVGV